MAAKSIGTPTYKIILETSFAEYINVVIVQATLLFAGMIVVESGLSFLGFGISKAIPSWGNMLSDAQEGDVISGKTVDMDATCYNDYINYIKYKLCREGLKMLNPRGRDVNNKRGTKHPSTFYFISYVLNPSLFSIFDSFK